MMEIKKNDPKIKQYNDSTTELSIDKLKVILTMLYGSSMSIQPIQQISNVSAENPEIKTMLQIRISTNTRVGTRSFTITIPYHYNEKKLKVITRENLREVKQIMKKNLEETTIRTELSDKEIINATTFEKTMIYAALSSGKKIFKRVLEGKIILLVSDIIGIDEVYTVDTMEELAQKIKDRVHNSYSNPQYLEEVSHNALIMLKLNDGEDDEDLI